MMTNPVTDRVSARLLSAAQHYANNYLRDERIDPDLCIDDTHHRAVLALFDAIEDATRVNTPAVPEPERRL